MLVSRKKFGPLVHEIFVYEQDILPARLATAREYRSTSVANPPRGYNTTGQTTLYNDLTLDEAEILASFNATTRNEVRKAQRLGVTVDTCTVPEIVEYFADFARQKGIATISERSFEWMNGRSLVTKAMLNGDVLAMHSYFLHPTNGIVRLFNSASHFRAGGDRNLIGSANRFLHYDDMLRFKRMGFSIYDFGGYAPDSSDPLLKQISTFKGAFGGLRIEHYHHLSKSIGWIQSIKRALAP